MEKQGGAATAHAVHAVAVSSHASSGAAPVGFNSGGGGGAAAAAGAGGGTGGEEGAVEMASWGGAGDGWARWWQSDMVTVVENSGLPMPYALCPMPYALCPIPY